MTISVALLNSSGKLDKYADSLNEGIDKAVARIGKFFELSSVDITVSPFQKDEESPSGIGGLALSEHRLELLVDCSRDDLDTVIKAELLDVLAHEYHHCMRMRFHKRAETLSELLVMEGMACHFENTVTRSKQSTLFKELLDYDWRNSLKKMSSQLDSRDFSLDKLFLGSHPDEFPKYAGYWIGFNLVSEYIKANDVTDTDIVGLDAKHFF